MVRPPSLGIAGTALMALMLYAPARENLWVAAVLLVGAVRRSVGRAGFLNGTVVHSSCLRTTDGHDNAVVGRIVIELGTY